MWFPVNLLKHSPKNSDLTKRDASVINLSDVKGTLGKNHRSADFRSVLDPLTLWIKKGVLKQELSGIQETTLHRLNNDENN